MQLAQKKALLITYPNQFAITEAKSLAETTGYSILETVCQKHITMAKFGIGKGKAEVVKEKIMELKPNVILFDEVLKPSQQYNLSKLCNIEVIDREKLILEIFLNRAVTNESKIQVKLAQLKYDIVRVKEKVRLSKGGGEEQPGFLGVGRYDADIEILNIKRRTVALKKKLNNKETKKHRITTVTTYTRSSHINEKKAFFTDTIGFISKLPPYMIEAFKSTLSEINFADIILLVIDFSEEISSIREKLKSSLETLSRLEVPNNKLILVLNKTDLVKQSEIEVKLKELNIQPDMDQIVLISSKTGQNIDLLINKIDSMILTDKKIMETTK